MHWAWLKNHPVLRQALQMTIILSVGRVVFEISLFSFTTLKPRLHTVEHNGCSAFVVPRYYILIKRNHTLNAFGDHWDRYVYDHVFFERTLWLRRNQCSGNGVRITALLTKFYVIKNVYYEPSTIGFFNLSFPRFHAEIGCGKSQRLNIVSVTCCTSCCTYQYFELPFGVQ